MPTVDEVVTTVIEIKDAAVSQAGFGVPLIAAYHNFWADRVRTFSELTELTAAPLSVPTTHPVYLQAQALKAQKPSPPQFKVGKRLGSTAQIVVLTPGTPVQGDVYSVTVNDTVVSVTAGASPTVSSVSTALATAITAVGGMTAVGTTVVTVTGGVAGARHRFDGLTTNLTLKETTVNPSGVNIQTDLAAIRAADGDWYGLMLDTSGGAEILAAAAWAETERVILFVTPADADCLVAATTTDVGSALKTAGYSRTVSLWHGKPGTQAAATAWAGRMLPKAPGSANWANKSLAGVDKSALSTGERAALRAKNVNYYVDVKGVGFTLDGRAASGRFVDITHGMDWFEVRTQERIVGLLANNDKVPYTDNGGELVRAQIVAQILEGIGAAVIDGAQAWSVTVPAVSTVNPNDKIARYFPNVRFSFVLQGAINKVAISGTVLIAL